MNDTRQALTGEHMPLRASRWLLCATGAWLVGLGFYFIAWRPPVLPEDLRFMAATQAQLRMAAPALDEWLHTVFIVMGGFMISTGALTIHLATVAMRHRSRGMTGAIALAGGPSVALMSVMNFELHSDFRWMLLVPALAWFVGLVSYVAGRKHNVVTSSTSPTHPGMST